MIIPAHEARYIRAALNSGKATADEIAVLDQALASAEAGIDVEIGIFKESQRLTGSVLSTTTPVIDR